MTALLHRPRLMFYCQHLLGMGHLMRSLDIMRALKQFEVQFIHGGEPMEIGLPDFVELIQLPPIRSDEHLKHIRSIDNIRNIDTIKLQRQAHLMTAFEAFRPHIMLIELFPFGRPQFAYELLPVLARNRVAAHPARVVCSVRDILVKKSSPELHEAKVCEVINRYFDQVLIHSDPDFQRLDDSFSRVADLKAPLCYTGYVAQPVRENDTSQYNARVEGGCDKLLVASIGGGRIGHALLEAAIKASTVLHPTLPHRLFIFTGPYMEQRHYDRLLASNISQSHITLERFTQNFVNVLAEADLSISMAGYNTCMNILQTGVRALVLPFSWGGNDEQARRAAKLQARGLLEILNEDDLDPQRLARKIRFALDRPRQHGTLRLQTDGARTTAYLLDKVYSQPRIPARVERGRQISRELVSCLKKALTQVEMQGRELDLFLRDDDVYTEEDTLKRLSELVLIHDMPINLEVVPARLTDAGINMLNIYKGFNRNLMEFHQHGWRHANHEETGRKCEFGPGRTYAEQYRDIARGKHLLETTFGECFFPAFTPPWNRCSETTFQVLDDLSFPVLSKDKGDVPVMGYRFREVSTSIDILRWKGGVTLKPDREIVTGLIEQFDDNQPIGILLHHEVMDENAFGLVDELINILKGFDCVRFHTLRTLMEKWEQSEPVSRRM